ncbi:SET domain-containing protein [Amniculicola lignicola CBS 123094]|uniref:SET domain-containing protein n=1 Tax=Amniculicola lignicola CBS 123094 TaxID=1392246 RepID=A0A6A5WCG7_9PLEO|nr:SET domain-containing protein [Amniculicola lignicola CBS 123094]
MTFFAFSLLAIVFTSPVSSSPSAPPVTLLKQQCWHEYPFTTSLLQSSPYVSEADIITPLRSSTFANIPTVLISSARNEATSEHAPWSYPPVCTTILPHLSTQLCVYTNTSFSNGRGISIFTTPSIARDFANLPAFQDPAALLAKDVNTNSGVWSAEKIEGKGVGLVAKRNLEFGDRVTAYTPALIAVMEGELSTAEREKYWRIAIDQLPKETGEMYLGLATVFGIKSVVVQDVVKANSFQLDVGGATHLAVYPETSRMNHACSPNAQYNIDPTLLTHFVHATRPIEKGEEITISYTSPLDFTDARQHHLKENFFFTCSCSRCNAKDQTDKVFRQMQIYQNILNGWDKPSKATPEMAENLIDLYRKEGLEGFLDIPYGYAALAYNAVGNTKVAEKYAHAAKAAILMKDGQWTNNLKIWNKLLENPKDHWSYRYRVR